MSLEKIKKALEGVEIDFNLDDLQIMPKEDFTTMVQGYKDEIETTKTKSNKIGREEILKELKNDIGLDYEQRKNPENLKKAFIEKFGKPDDVDNSDAEERIKLLNEKYTKDLEDRDLKYNTLETSYKTESDNKTIHDALTTSFAEFDGKTNYKLKDLVKLAKVSGEFIVVDGKVFQSRDGEPMKNDLLQGITSDAFAKEMMLEDGYIKKVEGGRVMGDETKGGTYTMEQFIAAEEANGGNVLSLEFDEKVTAAQEAGTLEK